MGHSGNRSVGVTLLSASIIRVGISSGVTVHPRWPKYGARPTRDNAIVVQLVEHGSEKPGVTGSRPVDGTIDPYLSG